MVFVLIFLWTIAAVLLVNNPKNESTRWVAFSAFAAGGGGLSRAMTETAIPYLHTHELITPTIENILLSHPCGSLARIAQSRESDRLRMRSGYGEVDYRTNRYLSIVVGCENLCSQ